MTKINLRKSSNLLNHKSGECKDQNAYPFKFAILIFFTIVVMGSSIIDIAPRGMERDPQKAIWGKGGGPRDPSLIRGDVVFSTLKC